MHPQLTLPLGIVPSSSFENFFPGHANELAADTVRALITSEIDDLQLFLWGERNTGKTHLLSAACQLANASGYQVAYLPGELLSHEGVFERLEHSDLVCIDDLQLLPHAQEESLFYCVNRCQQVGTRLLFAASAPSDQLDISLADLCTRLNWGGIFQLQPLSEDELKLALFHLIRTRDMQVAEDIVDYLLKYFPRDFVRQKQIIEALDAESLQSKRKVTIPLLRSVLAQPAYDFLSSASASASASPDSDSFADPVIDPRSEGV